MCFEFSQRHEVFLSCLYSHLDASYITDYQFVWQLQQLLLSHLGMSDSVQPHRRKPTRLLCPWGSAGKNTGVGCHFLLQCLEVKSEREVTQSCQTLRDPMDCSLPGSSVHGIFQARGLEWGVIAFSGMRTSWHYNICGKLGEANWSTIYNRLLASHFLSSFLWLIYLIKIILPFGLFILAIRVILNKFFSFSPLYA